jgi:deoxyribonuclease V
MWPRDRESLIAAQRQLACTRPDLWRPGDARRLLVGACFVCFPRGGAGPGARGDRAWSASVVHERGRLVASALAGGRAGGPYEAGLLALREGAVLEAALRALPVRPDVLLVNAGGADHPRGAGLAVQLGQILDMPTVGVTDRPLVASGDPPGPLLAGGREVARWVTTRAGARPVVVHAGWRTDLDTAVEILLSGRGRGRARTPAGLRAARTLARSARANS